MEATVGHNEAIETGIVLATVENGKLGWCDLGPDVAEMILNGVDSVHGRPYLDPRWRFVVNRVSKDLRRHIMHPPQRLLVWLRKDPLVPYYGLTRVATGRLVRLSAISDALAEGLVDVTGALTWACETGASREMVGAMLLASGDEKAVAMATAWFLSNPFTTTQPYLWVRHFGESNRGENGTLKPRFYGLPPLPAVWADGAYYRDWNARCIESCKGKPKLAYDNIVLVACRADPRRCPGLVETVLARLSEPPRPGVFRLCVYKLALRRDFRTLEALVDRCMVLRSGSKADVMDEYVWGPLWHECMSLASVPVIEWLFKIRRPPAPMSSGVGNMPNIANWLAVVGTSTAAESEIVAALQYAETRAVAAEYDFVAVARVVMGHALRRGLVLVLDWIAARVDPFSLWNTMIGVLDATSFCLPDAFVRGAAWLIEHAAKQPNSGAWGVPADPVGVLIAKAVGADPRTVQWPLYLALLGRWPADVLARKDATAALGKRLNHAIDKSHWRVLDRLIAALDRASREGGRSGLDAINVDVWPRAVFRFITSLDQWKTHTAAETYCARTSLSILALLAHRCGMAETGKTAPASEDRDDTWDACDEPDSLQALILYDKTASRFWTCARVPPAGAPTPDRSGTPQSPTTDVGKSAVDRRWKKCQHVAVRNARMSPVSPIGQRAWRRWCRPAPIDSRWFAYAAEKLTAEQAPQAAALTTYLRARGLVAD